LHRERTGEGQKLETCLFGTGLALQAQLLVYIQELDVAARARELEVLRTARASGKRHTQVIDTLVQGRLRDDMPETKRPVEVPDCQHRPTDRQVYPYYRVYPTADGYLTIAALNRGLREKLCAVLGLEDPHVGVDLGNATDEAYEAQKGTMRRIEARLLEHPNAYWTERLEAAGVPCSPVSYAANLYEDPQAEALGLMWELENRELGKYKSVGHPIRYSKTPATPRAGAPDIGEHTTRVLAGAGFTEEEIRRYREAGVVK
jgi:formyl-CoA transferase